MTRETLKSCGFFIKDRAVVIKALFQGLVLCSGIALSIAGQADAAATSSTRPSSSAATNTSNKTLSNALTGALKNSLKDQSSPYLRLHANDPIAWQVWAPNIMQQARAQGKLMFVSIGYFSCYWCHVMQRESFSNQKIAKVLNDNFIAVKVDRELNPALDAYLIDFVLRTRGNAGWPLNVIISPEGYPVLGMTYLPRDQLAAALQKVLQLWQQNNTFIRQMAQRAAMQLHNEKKLVRSDLSKDMDKKYLAMFLKHSLDIADELSGGFGDQSKFPMVPQLLALLDEYRRNPRENLKHFLQLTLDQMFTQGLHDRIGGGFFRYTIDPSWQTPHFEKMLYDNAGLSVVYSRAAKLLDRKVYLDVMRETLDFMVRELTSARGALVSSLSAVDDHNIEGGYYLWDRSALKKTLNASQYRLIEKLWGLEAQPRFETGYLPIQVLTIGEAAAQLDLSEEEIRKSLVQIRRLLFNAREKRSLPVDTKQLAGWNGLALQAFVEGEQADGSGRYKAVAQQIRNYLTTVLWDGSQLHRMSVAAGKPGEATSVVAGTIEDYAFSAQGLWYWYLFTGNKDDLKLVNQWVHIAWQRFFDNTGWRLSDHTLLPGYYGSPVLEDDVLPSASATLIRTSLELLKRHDDPELRARVLEALSIGHDAIAASPFYYPSQIQVIGQYLDHDSN